MAAQVAAAAPLRRASEPSAAPIRAEFEHTEVIEWLRQGAYVRIHGKVTERFFHTCMGNKMTDEEVTAFFVEHQVVSADISIAPIALHDGEWNGCIKLAGFQECICSLKNRASNLNVLPFILRIQLTRKQTAEPTRRERVGIC